jgi:RNA polymerase sigma factor (sigma-70 family)
MSLATHARADCDIDRTAVALLERVADTATLTDSQRQDAFRQLYDLTSGRLFAVAANVLRNRQWAEDVLQDAYFQVWRAAGTYQTARSSPFAWMTMIVRSRALDHLRRRRAERLDTAEAFDDETHDAAPDVANTAVDQLVAAEEARAVHACLRKLEPAQREVISVAYWRDLSHSEVAHLLQQPVGTVKSRMRRGLQAMRGGMQRYA